MTIALILGISWLVWKLRKRTVLKEYSPEEIAIKQLDALAASSLIQDNQYKIFHSKVSLIVRQYIHHRFSIQTLEVPTPIFLHELANHTYTETSSFEQLSIVLKHADLIKFAKASPLDLANQKAIETPKIFIEITQKRLVELEQKANTTKNKENYAQL